MDIRLPHRVVIVSAAMGLTHDAAAGARADPGRLNV
jgi:hypothetical protein